MRRQEPEAGKLPSCSPGSSHPRNPPVARAHRRVHAPAEHQAGVRERLARTRIYVPASLGLASAVPFSYFVSVLPPRLQSLRGTSTGAAWLASLPDLVEECVKRWSLRLGEPYPDSHLALVLPVTMLDGRAAVLKIQYPHEESDQEAAALKYWDGDGAIRLLDHDNKRHALLLERCVPGTHLAERDGDEALGVMIGLLPRLWKPASRLFQPLAVEAQRWVHQLPSRWERAGRPFERELVDVAVDLLESLPGSQGEQVLVHQDLHADNVLQAQREPWLVIDPKPLAGEREFGVAPIARSSELGHDPALVEHRLHRLTRELNLDHDRARGWTIAQTLAWSFEGDRVLPRHVEIARWLLRPR
jgi:streptomycin 6-kinase